ncbi:MAG: hypothetical protein H6729_16125 [Deltaproteobacteria bacterium]|nr:hypothetical protein [Deltaproteobacteria bacterium]
MADSLARKGLRWFGALLWTGSLACLLLGADRWWHGTPVPIRWLKAHRLADVPNTAGIVLLPKYLPDTIAWPPAEIVYRTRDGQGVWIGLRARQRPETRQRQPRGRQPVVLWYGRQTDATPWPEALGRLADCASSGGNVCPAGWSLQRRKLDSTTTIQLLTQRPAKESARILKNLAPHDRDRPEW